MQLDKEAVSHSREDQSTTEVDLKACDFNLALATFTLLEQAGCIPSITTSTNKQSSHSLQDKTAHSHELWLPLISTADFQVLLAAIPVQFRSGHSSAQNVTKSQLLDTVARLALEPSLTLHIMRQFKPVSPHLWGRWLEMLGFTNGEWPEDSSIERTGELEAIEKVYLAMVRILPVFDNIFT
jgi:midasin